MTDDYFNKQLSAVFSLLKIHVSSGIFELVDRKLLSLAYGDLRITQSVSENRVETNYLHGVQPLVAFNTKKDSIEIGPNIKALLVVESGAILCNLLSSNSFKEAIAVKKEMIVITPAGRADLFTRRFLFELKKKYPKIPVPSIFDADSFGIQIFEDFRTGSGGNYAYLNEFLTVNDTFLLGQRPISPFLTSDSSAINQALWKPLRSKDEQLFRTVMKRYNDSNDEHYYEAIDFLNTLLVYGKTCTGVKVNGDDVLDLLNKIFQAIPTEDLCTTIENDPKTFFECKHKMAMIWAKETPSQIMDFDRITNFGIPHCIMNKFIMIANNSFQTQIYALSFHTQLNKTKHDDTNEIQIVQNGDGSYHLLVWINHPQNLIVVGVTAQVHD